MCSFIAGFFSSPVGLKQTVFIFNNFYGILTNKNDEVLASTVYNRVHKDIFLVDFNAL